MSKVLPNEFFASAPAGLALLDEHLRFVQINEALAKVNGLTVEEHIGRTVREVLPQLAPTLEPVLQKVLTTGEAIQRFELTGETPKSPGMVRHWVATCFPIAAGPDGGRGVGALIVETSELRRADETIVRQAHLLDLAREGIFVRDMEGVITFWNRGAAEMYGWTRDEALGRIPNDLLQTQYPKPLQEIESDVIRAGYWEGELVHTRRNGAQIAVDSRWALQRDNTGLPLAILEINTDVTERKRTESALHESESRFRYLFENSPDAVFVEDENGVVLDANPAACRLHNVEREQLIGKNVLDLVPDDRRDEVARQFREWFTGEATRYDGWTRTSNGQVMPVAIRGSRIAYRGKPAVLLHVRDVTEQRRAEEALQKSEQLLRGLFESAPDTIVLVNAAGRIERVNSQTATMFGFPSTELVGQPVEILIPERFSARHNQHRGNYSAAPKARAMGAGLELYGRRKDGTEFPVDIMLSPLETEHGTMVVAVVRDITRRKQSEEALRQLSVELLRSQDEERRRIARELHDVTGQKLAVIAMHLSKINEFTEALDPVARKALDESITLLDQCSHEIRTLSYLLHPPLLDERGLTSALRWYVDGFTQRSGIAVDLDIPHDVGRLPQEVEMALFRVVQEGLTNTHRHSESSTAAIRLRIAPTNVTLEVQDAGKGFADQQADGRPAVLGVGLAGMRERVKQLGGRMEIESSAGDALRVALPLNGAHS